jgi:hypothetical protein
MTRKTPPPVKDHPLPKKPETWRFTDWALI